MKEYYEILKELREDHDYTQREIAGVLRTTQQVYSRYERGVNEMPVHHLRTLCEFYRVSADYVLSLKR
ncbi:MAG: helix-turn-helix domain-containing protein [Dysosmobacter sp.]|nr:helix-turn-helix domain-containing protein [Dysosmobacter sp.]